MERQIFFLDVISFFTSVEELAEPGLRGRPLVISPGENRSLVLAASAPARENGVERGITLAQARRFCPGLLVIPPNESLYRRASAAVFLALARFSPTIEPVGPGHAYLDMTGTGRLLGSPADTALALRRELKKSLRLESTIGLAPNKLLSNAAAHFAKPEEIFAVLPGEEKKFLAPLPLDFLPELREDAPGKETRRRLREFNLNRIGEIAVFPASLLGILFGGFGLILLERAQGIDPRPVHSPEKKPELTFTDILAEDTNDSDLVETRLRLLAHRAGFDLRRKKIQAGILALSLRYADERETRECRRFPIPTNHDAELFAAGKELLARSRRTRISSLEISLSGIRPAREQAELFPSPARILEPAIDRIHARFGENAIRQGI
ncbi:MAG: DNA polymerase IV [bacterium]|nr:DNA polymerase IV [bacterium]